MLKQYDFKVERTVELDSVDWLRPREALEEGLGGNREYADFRGITWKTVRQTIELEEPLLKQLEASDDPASLVSELEEQFYEDDDFPWTYGLDIGVVSAVLAISASRCVPVTSCNGGCFGDGHLEAYPLVAFYARKNWVPELIMAAEEADVGLENSHSGSLCVYSNDILKMTAFARTMVSRSNTFRKLRVLRSGKQRRSGAGLEYQQSFTYE